LAALIIESGHAGHDPLADIEQRVGAAIEALPGVVAAIAWLRTTPQQRAVYVALEPDRPVRPVRRGTIRILRRHRVSVEPARIRIAPLDTDRTT
jgi:hypothetical protein